MPVAPGAAGLLVVRLDGAGDVVVDDEPDVRLVDPHAEGVGRDGHRPRRVHEPLLIAGARGEVHPRVVGEHGPVLQAGRQDRRHLVHRLARGAIDDGAARLLAEQAEKLLRLLLDLGDSPALVDQVGAVEAGDDDGRLAQAELVQDVCADVLGRGGGEGDTRRVAEPAPHLAQAQILRPKVMPPLADTVRLVHREQLRPQLFRQRGKLRREKPLRRHVQQPSETVLELPHHLAPLDRRQRAVEQHRRDPLVSQLLDLVLHQRDQRRDDDGQPVLDRCGKLIAQALARPRRHDAEHVLAAQHVLDHLALGRPKFVEAEEVLEVLAEVQHLMPIIPLTFPKHTSRSNPRRPRLNFRLRRHFRNLRRRLRRPK